MTHQPSAIAATEPGPHHCPRRAIRALRALAGAVAVAAGLAGCVAPPTDSPAPGGGSSAPTASNAAAAPTQAEPEKASPRAAPRPVAHAKRHMIVAANPLAAEAGLEILRAGGNALDATIAAQMVLGLVEPQSSGLGGGGFLMTFDAKTGDIAAYDGRETAPASASADMFLGPDGAPRKFRDVVPGGLSVGVPGLLRMLELAHKDHGKLPWARLFEPAIALARSGFPVSQRLHDLIEEDYALKDFPAARSYFFDSGGNPWPAGHVLRNPDYAATLRRIANEGAQVLYQGDIAAAIATAVTTAPRNPARMTAADLSGYRAIKRAPLCGPYRQWLVCGMPPPSSGGIALLQILGLVQGADMKALGATAPGGWHRILEASRLAFADRNAYVSDPNAMDIGEGALTDPGYLAERARLINWSRSMGTALPGNPGKRADVPLLPVSDGAVGVSTTHLSVVDDTGNAVALTSSIESAFGSRLMVRGFLLNNQLTDFSFSPEENGKPVVNRAAAGKRPRSSMAPTLVFDFGGHVAAVLGSPGGSRIIGYVAEALIAMLDWDMDPQRAAALGHAVNRNGKTELEAGTEAQNLKPALEALGHEVTTAEMTSGLHLLRVTPNGIEGGADPRREGIALGD